MSEQIKQIAERIRGIREIVGLTAETASEKIGVELLTYLSYESGETDIPMSFLYEAANVFGIDLLELIKGESPKLHSFNVVRKDKGINVDRHKDYKYQSLAFNYANKKMEPFMVWLSPEKENVPASFSSHAGQEFNYILEGTVKIIIDGHDVILNEGDSIYFDSALYHGMKTVDGKPARFLAIITGG
jgi:transcriptional regulator with XRE-family HTH domain